MLKFILYYKDKEEFVGDPLKGDWNNAPNDNITSMTYLLGSRVIIFQGYKQYNHLLEHNKLLNSKNSQIRKIFLMGRKEYKTEIITIDLAEEQIYRNMVNIGHEYGNQILTGWKEGILNAPKCFFGKGK